MGLQCGEKGTSSKHQMGKLTMVGRQGGLPAPALPTNSLGAPQGMRPQVGPTQVSPGPSRPVLAPSAQTQASLSAADPELPSPHYPDRMMNGKRGACLAWGKETPAIGHFSRLRFQAPPLSPLLPHKGAAVCSVIRTALFWPEEKPGPADGR